jgi:hypothetical protein
LEPVFFTFFIINGFLPNPDILPHQLDYGKQLLRMTLASAVLQLHSKQMATSYRIHDNTALFEAGGFVEFGRDLQLIAQRLLKDNL